MTEARRPAHVYLRAIMQGERSSLYVLATQVTSGSTVLDLGTGSGALGNYLHDTVGCAVDGLTLSEAEAVLARPYYRRLEVVDLEQPEWVNAFAGERYDFIVAADVLEHLRQPEAVLHACEPLLAPGGRLLISVPNAAYSGLVAELLQGNFTYRDEGLLDRTHLRFFTRRSLEQFLGAEGWSIENIQTIDRPVIDSEFRAPFDQLPPAVARYLLAVPDSAAYQFIVTACPASAGRLTSTSNASRAATALFSAQLYLGDEMGFHETRKIVVSGIVGAARQLLSFRIPADSAFTRLRLDPADRPGFLYLYCIRLLAGKEVFWQWRSEVDGFNPLEMSPHHDMVLRPFWPGSSALALLYGDDPWIELPVPASALAMPEEAVLEVELGWPMSADYMALAEVIAPLQHRIELLQVKANQELEQVRQLTAQVHDLAKQSENLTQQNNNLKEDKNALARQELELQANLNTLNVQYAALADHLRWIENSTVFRMTRPLVHAKIAVEKVLGLSGASAPVTPTPRPVLPTVDTVDVIVPVYQGLADTQKCVRSVLASQCHTPWRLVIVNDASPESEITQWLREVSRTDNRIVLLENEENLGFVGTVNRGMALSDKHDVLLLNSDTEVANDWLDRLRQAAYSDARIASVTPFSNNATICSYPRFCEANELPPGWDTARLDALFAQTNAGQVIDVPTGVGFCMYIRRDSLNALGLFDAVNFGKGYGEENDFCRRAAEAGWRNLHALDTFVLHTGGVSFGDSKSRREQEAIEKLRRLHPSYDSTIHTFVMADPVRPTRLAIDLARIRTAGLPVILAVVHDRGGGTLRHAVELARHLQKRATFFSLSPAPGSAVWLELMEPGTGFRLEFSLPAQWQLLLDTLHTLGIVHLHYHHLLGHREEILHLGEQLGVPWDFTVHDFYSMCPRISLTDDTDQYCGEEGEGQCKRCQQSGLSGSLDIVSWRERYGDFLKKARHVLAPSRDTARRFLRMWPAVEIKLAPHVDLAHVSHLPKPKVLPLLPSASLKVAVIGAISRIKGADLLEDVAVLAAKTHAPVEFHLIGYAYRELIRQPRASLTVHGPYQEDDLQDLLRWIKPDIVWFSALWPETYSYTLSSCLAAGLPVVAPHLGAFPERLSGRSWSWLIPWDTAAAQWLAFFNEIRKTNFSSAQSPFPHREISTANVDTMIGSWSYDVDYLHHVNPSGASMALAPEFLASLRPGITHSMNSPKLKYWILNTLVRLRASLLLRRLVRAIPLSWQREVKTWLKA